MKKLAFFLLIPAIAWSAPNCTTLLSDGFSQDQINLTPSLSYELGYALDTATLPPTVTQSGNQVTVCFQSPSFDPTVAITTTTLVNRYQIDLASRTAAATQIRAWATELSTTTTAVIVGYNNFGSLTQTQINQGTKNIVRILWLRQLLGIDPQ